ncbi:hypothetical protein [Streptomyces laurentii]|uniref:hypothetical protein n=1 Tax=Streptomyces laurentii TaxID=39478 RepID=UPI00368611AE
MRSIREAALAALRQWSEPSARARLIAAAWNAGATNVNELAEAARCSRQTVYTALSSQGIDPAQRPKGTTMLTIDPLDIEGFTGVGERMDAEYDAALRRWADVRPGINPRGPQAHAEGMRLVALMDTVARYADVRDRLVHEQVARAERDRLLHRVETCWEALSTAAAWHAAHHAYVLAVDEARIAVDMWRERAETARQRPWYCDHPRSEAAYAQVLAAGHPALEDALADLDPAPAETAERLLADLDQAHTYRTRLAAQTLHAGQPTT